MAEGVFQYLVEQASLADQFHVESAGVGSWHVGEPADRRAQATARAHGINLAGQARQFTPGDFARLDVIIALDTQVAEDLRRLAPAPADRAKVHLLREYDPLVTSGPTGTSRAADMDVPDPYYGGLEGFKDAFQMIERSSKRLLEALLPPA